jgi:hypothetical protein
MDREPGQEDAEDAEGDRDPKLPTPSSESPVPVPVPAPAPAPEDALLTDRTFCPSGAGQA